MSSSLENIELEWIAQHAALRQALAELRIEQPSCKSKGYGDDIVLEDKDLRVSGGSDDLWDLSSDPEHEAGYSSDTSDSVTGCPNGRTNSAHPYGQKWLRSKCLAFANNKSEIDVEELQRRVFAILTSEMRGLHVRILSVPKIDQFYR